MPRNATVATKRTVPQLEKIAKGFANQRRIRILLMLHAQPELSVVEIADRLRGNIKTISEHLAKMHAGGLILKRHAAHHVRHALTDRGRATVAFLRNIE